MAATGIESRCVWAEAPAKLNVFLEVLEKRSDDFHELETVMVSVSLSDSIRFQATLDGQLDVRCALSADLASSRATIPSGPQNLAWQALDRLRHRIPNRVQKLGGVLEIFKRIPDRSGLGGGSSDAAAALRLARAAWCLPVDDNALAEIGAQVGSDVPHFLAPSAAAVCRGRGERVEPITLLRDQWYVVIKPQMGLATRSVYAQARVPPNPRSAGEVIAGLSSGDVRPIAGALHNRLQSAALQLAPHLAEAGRALVDAGASGHCMTGSGSAWYGLFRDRATARRAARLCRSRLPGWFVAHCRTLRRQPPVQYSGPRGPGVAA